MSKNLSSEVAISQGMATSGANTTDVNGTIIDMANYEGCLFVVKFGTAAADNTIHAQQDDAVGGGTMADVTGSAVALGGASDEIVWLDYYRPRERYIRVVADRGTSTTVDWGVAIQYGPRKLPVDNTTAGTIAGEQTTSPAEGTA